MTGKPPHFLPSTNNRAREAADCGVRKGQELMPGGSLDCFFFLVLHLLTPPCHQAQTLLLVNGTWRKVRTPRGRISVWMWGIGV